ncbi:MULTISPECIES: histidine phosphatase family protein [unclassified Rhizobium]|uniref:histidine phosphatase family protein n=1 Tax=unclassified Rhizobium TaxID=2613769 RepID=UPI001ADCC3CB|nr:MULTISPECIES: phosphoglycerate mutase family protein [unclassified Rhizobium]MBO9097742.1 phosphoglycerate mutase family protein [Rhizobium sp. L58/93]MBO9133475.1 phosphoglycerate mutase family protein [Rhizobium sp. B209b/85]MBO9167892.1 phosphoglycerate mutase family protein [Rhizobium sp. L245/93]MBO9183937.1 phosphoglycerate mutase family protein [Rhizobium sp. E27B/91]QXZ84172.1 phosphoglycerate mutase family protein [Rhizobium sp. K1/93]
MRIFLVRHGESLGNLDGHAYREFGDHNVPLSQWGYRQVAQAGGVIAKYLDSLADLERPKLRVWFSPFLRTRQSKDALLTVLPAASVGKVREDYLLREQDFGVFTEIYDHVEQRQKFPDEFERWARLRSNGAKFYARPPDGESRADVAQRMRLFLQTVMHEALHGHDSVLIVGHGVTNRAFEMNFLQHPVAWFEESDNPGNADVTLIEGNGTRGYTSTLLHKATDRQPGQDELRDAVLPSVLSGPGA